MTWIRTVSRPEADDRLRVALEALHKLYPPEYGVPGDTSGESESVVASHSLIPDALYHAFATFGVLMSSDLPLQRRHHEMIATVVSAVNRCKY